MNIGGARMSLFKKREKPLKNLPSLRELPEFPTYYPLERKSIKQAISPPQLLPLPSLPQLPATNYNPKTYEPKPSIKREPVFIRIQEYKLALETIQKIKEKIQEAEEIIRNIEQLREKEQYELKNWQNQIIDIREKIMFTEKIIFKR